MNPVRGWKRSVFAAAVALGLAGSAPAMVIVNDQGCLVHDGNGGVVFREVSDAVVTRDTADPCTVACKTSVEGAAGEFDGSGDGGVCGVVGCGFTSEWSQSIASDGSATLRCSGGVPGSH